MSQKVFRDRFASVFDRPNVTAKELVGSYLDQDSDDGLIEDVDLKTTLIIEAFSNLVGLLFEKKLITHDEVAGIIGAFDYKIEEK